MDLVIFIGLQASGKTTFYHQFYSSHVHISKDLMRNNSNRSRRQRQLILEAFAEGKSIVVDNTNPTVDDRIELIQMGREAGAKILGFYFESNLESCKERNLQRTGKAKVPNVAFYTTIKNLKIPTKDEGFDELKFVKIENNEFVIENWKQT